MGFARYAGLRNWRENSSSPAKAYVAALEKLGLRITFIAREDDKGKPDCDPAVQRFFALPLPFLDLDWFRRLQDYFFSVYENSLLDLALFTVALLLFFVGSRFVMSRIAIRSRRRIELVIGGWGTRGKSGTERLKAALFEAMGHSQVSKSTGCEAMFLYAWPFGKTREMFLFRPYDKATIWEQYDLVRLANKLSARVFLWECMALTPEYVRILQHQWMRDDYATITNTYPDHEDLQGPAGYNIPMVMTEFIPDKGNLITTEEQMLPILQSAAAASGTAFKNVGWQQAGLLTPDILDRFPYEEHPYNIALVVALAEEMGIDPDFALKEMADRVIADIGVLTAFPKARVRGRDLQFINGMSANERFGTLSNWQRMGFDSHDPQKEPGIILSTVINNRADRVSRSQMFAKMVVEDLAVDYHFLIGSNLEGFMGFVHKALDSYLPRIRLLAAKEGNKSDPQTALKAIARRQRIPTTEEDIQCRLKAMIAGISPEGTDYPPDNSAEEPETLRIWLEEHDLGKFVKEIDNHLKEQQELLKSYLQFAALVTETDNKESIEQLEEELHMLVRSWFIRKIIIVENYHANGEQIVDHICRHTPPGLHNRIMGLQNIKGTGLDFVYRWQAWAMCHQVCEKLTNADNSGFDRALAKLSAFQEYGLLSENHVRTTCKSLLKKSVVQTEQYRAEIAVIVSNMDNDLKRIKTDLHTDRKKKSKVKEYTAKLTGFIESMLDSGDAVRRRKCANRIYRDLANERISGERAAKELKRLNKRQKGGWLWVKLLQ